MTGINTNYNQPQYITEQTRQRVIDGSVKPESSEIISENRGTKDTLEISEDGIKSYKASLEKAATSGLQHNEDGKGVIMTDFSMVFSSRMPSIYGEKNENGEYERTYHSTKETADNMLSVYANMYDEIVKGYETGTRATYVEDKSSEKGYRKLTMDEELVELDKAYGRYADKYAANRDKDVMDILSAHAKNVSQISGGRTKIANEVNELMEKYRKDPVPDDFSNRMLKVTNAFVQMYSDNKGASIESLLQGINIFGK